MAADPKKILPIYKRQLAIYEAEGRIEQAAIQRRLIARIIETEDNA